MTDKKTEKVVFKNPDGETFDVYGAFDRHPALIRTIPFAPGDIQVKGVTMAYQGEDGTAQVSDGVIVTIDTNITGAYYITDTLTELLDNAEDTRTK